MYTQLVDIFSNSILNEQSEAIALSLGADPIMTKKDISDVMIFGKELLNISLSHPVTKDDQINMFTILNMFKSVGEGFEKLFDSLPLIEGCARFS